MTNIEYIKSLSGKEMAALVEVLMEAADEVIGEQCRECRYYREGEDFLCGAGGLDEAEANNRECRRATISWLYAEARALKTAVEKEEMKIMDCLGGRKG